MAEGIMKEIFGDKLKQERKGEESMREKCSRDFKLFCEYYLTEAFPSKWSEEFHFWLMNKLTDIVFEHADEETKNVTASPRGHAKSTLVTWAFPLWLICYKYKKFIVIVSATSAVAKQFLLNIRDELSFNKKIREDFGDLTGKDIWNTSELYTDNRVYITSKSAGTQMRGLNFNKTRPDMVILDDLEDPEQAESITQTEALENWLNKDVMPVGSPKCDYFYVGTVISYESLLWHLLTLGSYSMWSRKRFQAVIEFSQSPLWAEWEDIMLDIERENPAEDAKEFYLSHKEEMLEGTKVLWPDQRPDMYKHLMERRLASEEGFASEYQNDPQTESTRVFKTEWLEANYYTDEPEIKEVCIAIDPAVGGKRRNDFSAIIALGRASNNYFYVLEADLKKRKPDQIIEDAKDIVAKYYRYKPKMVVETNQMQQFFATTLQRDFVNTGIYLDWIEVFHKSGESKASRIESLVPHIKNGYIKFRESQKILLNQLKGYPKTHDDGPDALAMVLKPMLDNASHKFSFGAVGGNKKKDEPIDFLKLIGVRR